MELHGWAALPWSIAALRYFLLAQDTGRKWATRAVAYRTRFPYWQREGLQLDYGVVGAFNAVRDEVMETVAAAPVAAGRKAHNTYGELGNAEHVAKYGFALRCNPFDAARVGKAALVDAAAAVLGLRACRARCHFLALHSEVLEELDEDAEPFEVAPGALLSAPLVAALRMVFAAAAAAFNAWSGPDDARATAQHPCRIRLLRTGVSPRGTRAAAELAAAEAAAARARGVAEREAAGARVAALRLAAGKARLLADALAALRPLVC
ncbi:hypothetical protein WJX81_006693 [Elliptochloris bilobata]|uniref:Uncharacterized protein n=1 Tax=Elliptochloris bilobata TaxID=381761 RepID=A0AAW1QY77_9CHLO